MSTRDRLTLTLREPSPGLRCLPRPATRDHAAHPPTRRSTCAYHRPHRRRCAAPIPDASRPPVLAALRPAPFGGVPRPAREIAARALRHTDEQLSGPAGDTATAAHTPPGVAWLTYFPRQH